MQASAKTFRNLCITAQKLVKKNRNFYITTQKQPPAGTWIVGFLEIWLPKPAPTENAPFFSFPFPFFVLLFSFDPGDASLLFFSCFDIIYTHKKQKKTNQNHTDIWERYIIGALKFTYKKYPLKKKEKAQKKGFERA